VDRNVHVPKYKVERKEVVEEVLHDPNSAVNESEKNHKIKEGRENNSLAVLHHGDFNHLSHRLEGRVVRIPQEKEDPRTKDSPEEFHKVRKMKHKHEPQSPMNNDDRNRNAMGEGEIAGRGRPKEGGRRKNNDPAANKGKHSELHEHEERDLEERGK